MKRIFFVSILFTLLWCPGLMAGSMDEENSYEVWRINQELPAGSEYKDPDGDGYVNFEEYAFGLDPGRAESRGANRITLSETGDPEFPYMGKLTLRNPRPADVFYQIFRSADAGEDNPYKTWTPDYYMVAGGRYDIVLDHGEMKLFTIPTIGDGITISDIQQSGSFRK